MSDRESLPFDEVRVQPEGASEQRLTVQEFLDLDLHLRIRYILSGCLRFSRSGRGIDTDTALRALREHRP